MQQRYVVDVAELHRLTERNYAGLLPLLSQLESEAEVALYAGENLAFNLRNVSESRYTSDIEIEQLKPNWADYLQAKMTVRLYHDVRMAEIISSQGVTRLAARYQQPNREMRHRDEKHQVNQFLADWLTLCREQGHIQPKLSEAVQKFMPYYFK
ncbi:MAG: DUF1249 domain-containing protein [Idiomarinaceae bacterium]|uniref:DUF1249 domain-containing protein n=1 Tax=Idiomarina sp. 28-8 TaxID=1260624 RepID=UPI000310D5EA|nr:DUF1249 domain-containing protein [Idiomarina sp. 28-8]NWO03581.1 DUF1249 domain-containing protein [Idiomarinaceae bacterium]